MVSERLATLLAIFGIVLGLDGCAHHPTVPRVHADPLAALPGAQHLLELATPYDFRTDGASHLHELNLRLGDSEDSTAGVILARTYLDALLYAQAARDDALTEQIAVSLAELGQDSADPWRSVGTLFERVHSGPPGVERVAKAGRALVLLLRQRRMDPAYHKALAGLTKGPLRIEARLARILDLADGLDEVGAQLGPRRRLSALVGALGESVCPGLTRASTPAERWSLCDLSCPTAREMAGAQTPGHTVLLSMCGQRAGLSPWLDPSLTSPSILLLARRYELAFDDARAIGTAAVDHPLAHEVDGEVQVLVERFGAHPLLIELPLVEPGQSPDLTLPKGRSRIEPSDTLLERAVLVIDSHAMRIARAPAVVSSPDDGLHLLGEGEGLAFPGEAVVLHGEVQTAETRRAAELHVRRRLARTSQGRRVTGATDSLVTFIAGDVALKTVTGELAIVVAALGGAKHLRLDLAVWDTDLGRLGYRELVTYLGGEPSALSDIPPAVRPLDLRLIVTDGVVVAWTHGELAARFPDASGSIDTAALATYLMGLQRDNPGESVTTFVVEGSQRRVVDLIRLTEVTEAAGFGQAFLELDAATSSHR